MANQQMSAAIKSKCSIIMILHIIFNHRDIIGICAEIEESMWHQKSFQIEQGIQGMCVC